MIQSAQKKASTYKQGLVVIISAIPALTFSPNACLSLYSPWAYPRVSWVLGFTSICSANSGLDLLFAHLPSLCSLGSPVCSGPASARPLPVCCLAPAPCLHLHSPLPGPTLQHRLSPALVSRICTWHVVLYCVLGVFVVTAGPGFASAQQPPWVGDLMGKTQWLQGSCSRRQMRCSLPG